MRGGLLCLWLLVPAVALAYHYGPGQERLLVDQASVHLRQAQQHARAAHWAQAVAAYDQALEVLPAERKALARAARLERSKAQMQMGQLPPAYDDLTTLVEELEKDPAADGALERDAREALASAQYYLTWLMRLEGYQREDWEPQIEAARQNYALLAARAAAAGDVALERRQSESLEATIRLARMDIAQLQGLPLPKQCSCCKSGNCKKKGVCQNKQPKKKDTDSRGAGSGPPPDDGGN